MAYKTPYNFFNALVDRAGTATQQFQLWLTEFLAAVNANVEKDGVTSAIATGATVTHGLNKTPRVVLVTPQETGPTDVTVSAIGDTTFTINFGGGGTKIFGWLARG